MDFIFVIGTFSAYVLFYGHFIGFTTTNEYRIAAASFLIGLLFGFTYGLFKDKK